MSNKLQELTDKLYQEGLSKGKQEGDKYLENARIQANTIIQEAKAEAEAILEKARNQSEQLYLKAEDDVRSASAQALQATKKDIENLLINKVSAAKINEALSGVDFIKEIIRSVAIAFSASESKDMALILPASLQAQLEPWLSSELSKAIGAEIKADFSKKISGGFTIGPKDGSWFVNFSEATWRELIAEYLRPVTRKLLFGE